MRRQRGPFRYRRLQMLDGASQDALRPAGKAASPLVCPGCGACFRRGRWTWAAAPAGAKKHRCPACTRIAQRFPSGYVSLAGAFFAQHRAEVLARVKHCEAQEKATHPLERIIAITKGEDGTQVTTTSVHLARLIGHALQHAFKGDLTQTYGREDNLLRVRWRRDG
jgi:NMD protein affecting ribosome stability and mRNA decay